jgi:hypothetical protein
MLLDIYSDIGRSIAPVVITMVTNGGAIMGT